MYSRVMKQGILPFRKIVGMRNQLYQTKSKDDDIQKQIRKDQYHCDTNCFFETLEKDRSEHGNQCERDAHLMF